MIEPCMGKYFCVHVNIKFKSIDVVDDEGTLKHDTPVFKTVLRHGSSRASAICLYQFFAFSNEIE